jgi:uncharacterized protein involved in exopolysaccharide biosynthesis
MNAALLPDLLALSAGADVISEPSPPTSPSPSPRLAVSLVAFVLVACLARVFRRRTQGA